MKAFDIDDELKDRHKKTEKVKEKIKETREEMFSKFKHALHYYLNTMEADSIWWKGLNISYDWGVSVKLGWYAVIVGVLLIGFTTFSIILSSPPLIILSILGLGVYVVWMVAGYWGEDVREIEISVSKLYKWYGMEGLVKIIEKAKRKAEKMMGDIEDYEDILDSAKAENETFAL